MQSACNSASVINADVIFMMLIADVSSLLLLSLLSLLTTLLNLNKE